MPQLRRHLTRGILIGLTAVLALPGTVAAASPTSAAAPKKCTQKITGQNDAVLSVAKGERLCLVGATQVGAVNVAPGGSLSVTRSTITGVTTLNAGFRSLRFCGSKTVGAITVTGGKNAVVIGGSKRNSSCRANTIEGAVTLDANRAGVMLGLNRIMGAVTASANQGGTIIAGNRISGDLTCTTNKPRPKNAGSKNEVGGTRSGQSCASSAF